MISWYMMSICGCRKVEGLSTVFGIVPKGKGDSACRGTVWMGALTCLAILGGPNLPPVWGYKRARREQGAEQSPPKNKSKREVSVIFTDRTAVPTLCQNKNVRIRNFEQCQLELDRLACCM